MCVQFKTSANLGFHRANLKNSSTLATSKLDSLQVWYFKKSLKSGNLLTISLYLFLISSQINVEETPNRTFSIFFGVSIYI